MLVSGADKLVAGNIDITMNIKRKDEVGQLAMAFGKVVGTLKQFIQEMNHMSEQHDLGEIDARVPEEQFQGAYREMAAGVNNMVDGDISVTQKAMACVAEFSCGNFEAELEQFPGKKAFINENIEQLRKPESAD